MSRNATYSPPSMLKRRDLVKASSPGFVTPSLGDGVWWWKVFLGHDDAGVDFSEFCEVLAGSTAFGELKALIAECSAWGDGRGACLALPGEGLGLDEPVELVAGEAAREVGSDTPRACGALLVCFLRHGTDLL